MLQALRGELRLLVDREEEAADQVAAVVADQVAVV